MTSVTDFAQRELLMRRLKTSLRLARIQEARKTLQSILDDFQFDRLAFSEQRYVAYGIWNLLCETAAELKISVPPQYTSALLNGDSPNQLLEPIHAIMDCFEREVTEDYEAADGQPDQSGIRQDTIIAYMNDHFQDQNLSLNALAERFNMNPRRVSLIIKQKCGMNYQDYLTSLRIGMAQRLLVSGSQSVTEICALAGYSSMPHFVRTFKQVTGFTPTAYRDGHERLEREGS